LATYQAIAATGKAILGLLEDAYPRAEYGPARFDLYQTNEFESPMDDGFSLYLYRVTVNRTRRTMPTRPNANGERPVAPLSVDLAYLLTAWAKSTLTQHIRLGWAMRVLEDNAILPAGVLNHYAPRQDTFHAHESVELIAETLSLQDMSTIWEALRPNPPVSVTYVARLVELESLRSWEEAGPVQTRVFEMGRLET
jgi:hypothetical protein